MEKNQHNKTTGGNENSENDFTQNQPGQQVPAHAGKEQTDAATVPENEVHHSESSLPQNDSETLGTP